MNQRIFLTVINVFIFALLVYVGVVWALPMVAAGDWFGVALVFVVISVVWSIVKGDGV